MRGPENAIRYLRRQRNGKVLVALALALPAVVGLAALAISLANLQCTHSQLSAVVESAASAAIDTYNMTRDTDLARESAQHVASSNNVQGKPLTLDDEDIEFGRYGRHGTNWEFSSGERNPNAVRVVGRIVDDGRSGPARFARFLKAEREVELSRTTIATQLDRDIALVVDRSSSGAYSEDKVLPPDLADLPLPQFVPLGWSWCSEVSLRSRFRNVARAIVTFILELTWTSQSERLALVSFADEATIDAPLTLDYSVIVAALRRLASTFCGGASDKEAGINYGVEVLTDPSTARPEAIKLLILVSDSPYDEGDPIAAARAARQHEIVIHTISYGPNVDQALMNNIATVGGGMHWHATTGAEVSSRLRAIARSMPTAVIVDP